MANNIYSICQEQYERYTKWQIYKELYITSNLLNHYSKTWHKMFEINNYRIKRTYLPWRNEF